VRQRERKACVPIAGELALREVRSKNGATKAVAFGGEEIRAAAA
jgi:hypothetical protein